jgi:hypothetical protein
MRDGHDASELDAETLKDYWPSSAADIGANLRKDCEMALNRSRAPRCGRT